MKFKRMLSIGLAAALSATMFGASLMNLNAQAAENPNPDAAKYGIDAIRDSLNLVWNDEFGGEIGCGAEKQALATTNGFDENGNPTSDEVRANAKWSHERNTDNTPVTRNGQLQLYVGEDGRNSWTEDGVLHIRGQREEGDGYYDPITKKYYRWTADGLNSAYFENGETHRQAFRFGMMEARVYTVNGAAKVDENGEPVYDKDGNIQQDPATSQGLWNAFWTCGSADMSEETSALSFHERHFGWPYNGEIDICESATDPTQFCTYDYSKQDTLTDENGVVFKFNNGQYYIKHDENGKTLITDKSGNTVVSYDTDSNSYVIADGLTDFAILTEDDGTEYIELQKKYDIKQEKNAAGVVRNYVLDKNKKTMVDTDGNCYGTANKATAQYHHHTGTRVNKDGSLGSVAGAASNTKTCNSYAGYTSQYAGSGRTTIGDSGYHTYGIYWTPTQLVYYVDNSITGVYDISSPEYRALRECPQYAILTFPIGGAVPGSPNPALKYAEYLVDYVRIYQADDTEYGDTNSLDYKGSKGFPTLNEFDKGYDTVNNCVDMSYYQPVIDAYSHINIIVVGKEKNVEISGNCYRQDWGGPPFNTYQACVSMRSSAQLTTVKPLDEGKYDVYLQGVSAYYGKDYAVTLNDTDIGAQLKMYTDHLTDEYGRAYGGMAEAYLGTAEITNGSHNLRVNLKETYRPNDNQNTVINGGMVRAIIAVGKSSNTATVTVDEDSSLTPTTTTTTTTTTAVTTAAATTGSQQTTTASTTSAENTVIYDAYDAEVAGPNVDKMKKSTAGDHAGFTGKGFIDYFGNNGSSVTFTVDAPTAADYTITFRYEGKDIKFYPSVYLDGVKINTENVAPDGNGWVNYGGGWHISKPITVNITEGQHEVKIANEAEISSSYGAIDCLYLTQVSADEPTAETSTTAVTTDITTTTAADTTTSATTETPTTSSTTEADTTTVVPTTAGPTTPSTTETTTTTSATESTTDATTTTTTATTTVTTTIAPTTTTEITTTMTTTITEATTTTTAVPTTTEAPINYGDANGDGKITAADVLIIRKSIAGQSVTLNSDASDVNCDGKLTAADVLMIRKYIAGQDIVLGARSPR